MGFIDKLIHKLDDQYNGIEYRNDKITEIKKNIEALLNTNADDCISIMDAGFNNENNSSIESSELCNIIINKIEKLIYEYEKRIVVISANYDNTNMPWKLSIDLGCHLLNDKFNEFHIIIDFSNNRYCEVI
ncbi:MAG: hypothetical protein SPF17_00785 [Candidatus Mucispirillum faecigallinarum]|nr:hypothetical protein [Candidatus Mucispirillum faecigallinarum]